MRARGGREQRVATRGVTAASERASQGTLDADARARALVALEHVPSYGDANAWLGALAARTEEALAEGPPRAARAPLARLLARATRIVG